MAIGITTQERIGNALNLGSNLNTRNIGLLMERERGVALRPTLVTDLKEDLLKFGGKNPTMFGPHVMEQIFNNTGSFAANVYGARVVGAGSLAAFVKVEDAPPSDQQFITNTVQVATSTQPHISEAKAINPNVGDTYNISIRLASDPVGSAILFSFVAASTSAADVITGIKALWDASVPATTIATVVANSDILEITGVNNNEIHVVVTSAVNGGVSNGDIFNVIAGQEGQADVGTWGNDLAIRVYPIGDPNGNPTNYQFEVYYLGFLVETYLKPTWEELAQDVNIRSAYVLMEEISYAIPLTQGVFIANLASGVYDAPIDSDFLPRYHPVTQAPSGMAVFEGVDVQILACSEVFNVQMAKECMDFAEVNKMFFVFNMPYLATETILKQYKTSLVATDPSFGASILNWCEVSTDDGGTIWVPYIGVLLGSAYIRKAAANNGFAWIPPAGTETRAKGILRITHDNLTDVTASRYAQVHLCNIVKFIPNIGFCVWTSRTYSSNLLFHSIHVRLLTNWLIQVVAIRNTEFIQKLNTPALKNQITVSNLLFFKDLYEKGGIEQSIAFEQAVVIKVTTNKDDRKNVDLDIAYVPPETIEHLHITLTRNDGILVLNPEA